MSSAFVARFSCIGIVALAVLFFGCNHPKQPVKVDEAFAGFVESYTTGTISKNSAVQVRLMPGLVKGHLLNEPLKEEIFSFSPRVQGTTAWVDERTIEFRPAQPLQPGQLYEVKLELGKLTKVPKELKQFPFSIKVMEPAFSVQQNGLITDGNSATMMLLTGKVLTSDQEDSAKVEKILSAFLDKNPLPVQWTHDITGRIHTFRIHQIKREKRALNLELAWDGAAIGSSKQDGVLLEVPAIGDFKVINIVSVNDADHYAKIQFSAPVSTSADLRGLITTQPGLELAFSVQGSEVLAYPPGSSWGDFTLTVHPGIENIWNEKLSKKYTASVHFEDRKPYVSILGRGEIIPSSGKVILPFEASNLKAVDLTIVKIYGNNIPQFYQNNNYDGGYELRRVGKPLLQKTIRLDQEKGLNLTRTNRFSFELDDFLQAEPGAMYRVTIGFRPEYALYNCPGAMQGDSDDEDEYYDYYDGPRSSVDEDGGFWSAYNDYYPFGYSWDNRDNPCHKSYYNKERWETRNIMASNIGMVAKRGNDKSMFVFTSNLTSAEPMTGVDIELLNYQQQVIYKGKTDHTGMLNFKCPEKPFLLVARKGEERGYLKLDDGNSQMISRFDVSGSEATNGIKGMIYGERGVWRPGDSLYINFILEDKGQSIPADHPVEFTLYTPQGQLFKKMIARSSVSGLYTFKTATLSSSPTGNWTARVKVGGATFDKRIKIETIMPNRLKINLDIKGAQLLQQGEKQPVKLSSSWLFGAPAQRLQSKVDVTFTREKEPFPAYKGFVFDDPTVYFNPVSKTVFEGKLSEAGEVTFTPDLKIEDRVPGMLKASFLVKVFEPGGAFSTDYSSFRYSPFKSYIGLKVPEGKDTWDYLQTGKTYQINTVRVDGNGQPVAGTATLKAQLYKLEWRWWWDESGEDGASYISGNYKQLVETQRFEVVNGKGICKIGVGSEDWGRYLLVIQDSVSGHSAGQVIYFDDPYWQTRNRTDDPNSETLLSFTADKEAYKVNDMVKLNIPSSTSGKLLITLENGRKVLQSYWVEASAGQTVFQFRATAEMAPNIYAHVSLIQPHAQTTNDRPIRMYGVLPIQVRDPQTILQPKLSVADVVRPEQTFNIKVSEATGQAMAYSLAIVDEGLLDITRFKTPDPHAYFYAKEALGVKTWDIFDHVIGSFAGKYGRILTIGGDEGLLGSANANKANRFPPVVKYLGTFELKKGESRTHSVKLPPYFGAARVMLVAARDARYGSVEQSVTVRNPLMVYATAPRVMGPGEQVSIPVTVFATENSVKDVRISLSVNKNLEIVGDAQQHIRFDRVGEQTVYFKAKVRQVTGLAEIQVHASSGSTNTSDKVQITIRNPNPPVTAVQSENLAAGASRMLAVKPIGVTVNATAALELSAIPPLQLKKRLGYLISYPHGCVEQITSTAFAQLYLDRLTEISKAQQADIEKNVKATIQKLKAYQLTDGSFAYWPGGSGTHEWGTNYAGHFLLEAKSRGYLIPDEMLTAWLQFTRSKAEKWAIPAQSSALYSAEIAQVYRLYLLALAGSPQIGAMNRLKEFAYLTDESKWRLALTYQLSGYAKQAELLVRNLSYNLPYKDDQGYTFGSPQRNKAMLLEVLTGLKKSHEARKVMEEIASGMATDQWMSTQTTAYSLLAIAKYTGAGSDIPQVKATCKVNGQLVPVPTGKITVQIPLEVRKGTVNVEVNNESIGVLYVKAITEGQPLPGESISGPSASNLILQTEYFDLNGQPINPASLKQGTDFVAKIRVTHPGRLQLYKNIALTTIFPSGWEVINTRVWDAQSSFVSSPSAYQDIRDDRAYTYFDLQKGKTNTYYFMLNAAYTGKYYMPLIAAEAMYDHAIAAREKGQWVEIVP